MKCTIAGAGATAYCDVANLDRRPRLAIAAEFHRMLLDPVADSVWTSSSGAPIARVLVKEIDAHGGDLVRWKANR
jgi:hypothetical protein